MIIRRIRVLQKTVIGSSGDFAQIADELLPATIHLLVDADGETRHIYRDASATAFLNAHRSVICALRMYDDATDPLLILQIAWVLSEWVQGSGYQKLCSPFRNLREGQIKQCADHCSWMFEAAAAISRVEELGIDHRLAAHLASTAKRLSFGVPESGVALSNIVRNRISLGVELGGVGRGKIMDLLRAGFDDLTKIVEADDAQLTAVTRNAGQTSNLKIGVARFLDRLSNSSLADHTVRGQKLSCDSVVRRVYEKLGTEFEVAVCELISLVGINAELLDERKTPGCADILVHTNAGNLQVECKTRVKGAVTNSEAFEVLGKTVVGPTPIGYVTVGKPTFVDVAIKNSYSSGVTLLTHKVLVEAAIMVLEGKMTADELIPLLGLARSVDRSDLR